MTAFFKVFSKALVLLLIVALVKSAPADKNAQIENAADSTLKSSNQEQVTKSNQADTRTDAPASTGTTGPVTKPPSAPVATFFDNIFNIPTSVLRAVNQFLNNNIKFGQGQSSKTATSGTSSPPATAEIVTTTRISGETVSSDSDASKNSTARATAFFDNIFNIPITAINSVNSLLTGRKVGENGEIVLPKNNHS